MTQIAKFGDPALSIGRRLNELALLTKRVTEEASDQRAAQRLVDWFLRDRPEIVKHLRNQATITFGDETVEWQFPIINGVSRTIDRLAMAYREPPSRQYVKGGQEIDPESSAGQKIERMYRRLDLDKRLRQADQWATLLNVCHIEPVFRNGAIDWDIHLRPNTSVFEDPADHLEFSQFATARTFEWVRDGQLERVEGWRFWTEDEHFFMRKDGRVYSLVETDSADNPYAGESFQYSDRPIPVVTVRKRETDEYWGRYGADVVDAFEQANIQLANLWENLFLQTHGQPIAINLGIGDGKKKVKLGPKHPFIAEGVTRDDFAPTLEFAKPDTDAEVVRETVDWFIKQAGSSYGLPASAWASEEKVLSGFAKLVDNLELLEQRDREINDWVIREKQLFEWSRIVFNKWAAPSERIDDGIDLEVTFSEVEFPEAPAEDAQAWAALINQGLASPVDYLMRKHKISDREKARELAADIAEENRALRGARIAPEIPEEQPAEEEGQS